MKKNIKHFFLLSSMAVGTIYGINKFIEASSGVKKSLTNPSGYFFEWRYGNIFYTKQGEGAPLLLIHDLNPASSSVEWSKLVKKLSETRTVYTIDLLGCGRSDKPNLTYTNYMYVQLVTDFVKKIIQEKTDVIATGYSGSFTIMAANMDNNIFKKIFLISPVSLESLQANPDSKKNLLLNMFEIPILGTFFYNLAMTDKQIELLFENEYLCNPAHISSEIKDAYYEAAHTAKGNGKFLFGSILANYTNINIVAALKKIENPIFLIGNRENETSIEIIDSYVKYDENIETAYISHSSRLPQLETPEKLYEILKMMFED